MISRWTRAGAVGTMLVASVVAVDLMGAPTGAQEVPPEDSTTTVDSGADDVSPSVSDSGAIVVFASATVDADGQVTGSQIFLHDRTDPALPMTTAVEGSSGGVRPAVSGDGCLVSWSVDGTVVPPEVDPPEPSVPDSTTPDSTVPDSTTPDSTVPDSTTPDSTVADSTTPDSSTSDPDSPDAGGADPGGGTDADTADSGIVNGGIVDSGATRGDAAPTPDGSSRSTTSSITTVADPGVADTDAADRSARPARQVDTPATLAMFDRCAETPAPATPVADLAPTARFARPAISVDGSVIAVSTGDEVLRIERQADGVFRQTAAVDGTDATTTDSNTDRAVTDTVDLSDDGAVIVFAASPADQADDPLARTVHRFTDATVTDLLAGADSPSISGDATLVAARVVADPATEVAENIVVVPVADPSRATLFGAGTSPMLSDDGDHLVFVGSSGVVVHSATGPDDAPFSFAEVRELDGVPLPTDGGLAVDRYGSLIATDAAPAEPAVAADIRLTAVAAAAAFDETTVTIGTGSAGETVSGTLTITNAGPASFAIGEIASEGTFVVDGGTCTGSLRRGATCTIEVGFTFDDGTDPDAAAFVTVSSPVPGVEPIRAEVVATRAAPVDTGGATTGGTTTGGTTGTAATTGATSSTTGRTSTTTGRTSTTTGRTSTSSTTGRTQTTVTTTTTTTVPPGSGVVASPGSFEFAPTIVESGRRSGVIEIVNSADSPADISLVTVAGDAAFTIADDGCSATTLLGGARCTVAVDFAPTVPGSVSATLTASIVGGNEVSATLTGAGAPEPVVSLVPSVVRSGQVVSVTGSGFPTGLSVDVTIAGSTRTVEVDATGVFVLTVVVLPNTPAGPLDVTVTGQVDLFGDVAGSLLVSSAGDRSNSVSVLDGAGVNVGR